MLENQKMIDDVCWISQKKLFDVDICKHNIENLRKVFRKDVFKKVFSERTFSKRINLVQKKLFNNTTKKKFFMTNLFKRNSLIKKTGESIFLLWSVHIMQVIRIN